MRTRESVRADPVLRRAVLLAGAWLAVFALLTAATIDAPDAPLAMYVFYSVPIALGTALACLAAWRSSGRTRAFWACLAASGAAWLAGGVLWTTQALAAGGEPPFPSSADAAYLTCYVLVLPAVALGFRVSWLRVSRSVLDASVVVASVGLLAWRTLVEPLLAAGPGLATYVGIAYPLLGVATLVMVGVLGYGGHRQVPLSMGW